MNKKERKNIANMLAGIYMLSALAIFWLVFESTNFVILLLIIVSAVLVDVIVFNLLPAKKQTKTTSKKTTKSKQQRKKTSKIKSNEIPHNRQLPDNEIIELSLEEMSWREFERLCYLYYKAKGYKPKETKNGADGGVDLIYYHPYHKGEVAVQIKHYKNDIDVKLIRELTGAKRNHGCILAEFITTSGFTNPALVEADKFKIETHGRQWVEDKIIKWKDQETKKKKLIHA